MKKVFKTIICIIAMVMAFTSIKMMTKAAYFKTIVTYLPKKETIGTDEAWNIYLQVASGKESISNISSKNKKLTVVLKRVCTDLNTGSKLYCLQMYSKRSGIYKVGYTYTDANGVSSNKIIKIKVTDESPFVSVKLKGKELSKKHENIISGKKGKLVVKMRKGYKLEKIELEKYEYDSSKKGNAEYVTIRLRNKSKIEIPDTPYSHNHGGECYSNARYLAAESHLKITYRDKYSKTKRVVTYTIFNRLK